MNLEAEIQEVTAGIANQPEQPVEATPEVEQEVESEVETLEPEESVESQPKKPEDKDGFVPFPKKAKEAIARRERQINKLRGEYQALQQQLQQMQQQVQPQQNSRDGYPREDDFSTFAEYREAVARHEVESKYKTEMQKMQEQYQQQQALAQQQAWLQERTEVVAEKAKEYEAKHPEVAHILNETIDIADTLPPHIQQAFFEADDAPLSWAVLAKEGRLEALADLSPSRAAMEIAKAEIRGREWLKPKTSNAPAPIKANKGTGGFSKQVDQMNPEELEKWLTSI